MFGVARLGAQTVRLRSQPPASPSPAAADHWAALARSGAGLDPDPGLNPTTGMISAQGEDTIVIFVWQGLLGVPLGGLM